MPDLSADRPLPLPEKPFTKDDVDAAVQRLIDNAWEGDGGAGDRDDLTEIVRIVLTSMWTRSRLLPSSAEHREEWAWRVTRGDFEMGENDPSEATREEAVAIIRMHCAHGLPPVVRWRLLSRQVITGPWVEVDRSPTDG